jgi:hypothetical protein
MDDYVKKPAAQSSGYFALLGLGVAGLIVSYDLYPDFRAAGMALFVISLPLAFAGAGGLWLLRPRLNDFFYDILANVQDEVTEIFEDEPKTPAPRVIRSGNGDVMAELSTDSHLSHEDWTRVATVVRVQNRAISQQVLSRDRATKCLSRAQYQWMWNYLQEQGYLVAENGRNRLTREGQAYLDGYLGYPPAPRRGGQK